MRKILFAMFLMCGVIANARHILPEEAFAIALDFWGYSPAQKKAPVHLELDEATTSDCPSDWRPYYVFNKEVNGGFIIISGDDRCTRLLGYSDKGNFDFDHLPPQLSAMLEKYTEYISLLTGTSIDPSWNVGSRVKSEGDTKLLETALWGQGFPYNAQCPVVESVQCPTGCVATAMAIVMKYNNWPEGYDWDSMPIENVTVETSSEIARLMFDAGQSVFMDYGPTESGANMNWVGHKLQQDFKYSPDCQYITLQNFTTEEWRELIYRNIENNNPIIYSGTDMNNLSAHAFIIDGYKGSSYHINWGWDGSCNGYFDLEAFCPTENQSYTSNSGMVINIDPDKSGKEYSKCFVDYGYFWGINKSLGEAMNISVENVKAGEAFHVLNTLFTLPAGFVGDFGIAHVDKDGNIKEVLRTEKYNTWNDVDNEYKIQGNGMAYTNLIVNNSVESTDRIQLVSRDNKDGEYRLVLGTLEWPSWVPVCDNVPRYGKVRWNIDKNIKVLYNDFTGWDPATGSPYIELSKEEFETSILRGTNLSLIFSPYDENKEGVINVTIEGPQIYGPSKYCDRNIETAVSIVGEYTVTAEWIEPKDESIQLETPGTLKDIVPVSSAKGIRKLEISGKMNAVDFWYIRDNFSNLCHLDLHDVMIESVDASDNRFFETESNQPANSIPEWALTGLNKLELLILPSSIDAILANSLNSLNLHFIEIPQNVERIGMNAFYGNQHLDVIGVLNPIPVDVNECIFVETACPSNGSLFVPDGSIEKFRNAPVWREFAIIEEGKLSNNILHDIEIDNLIYDCYGSKASVVGYKDSPINIDIPDKIIVNNDEYVVTDIKDRTFQDCISLESVRMPNTIMSIGTDNIYLGYVFLDCTNLKSVKLSESLKKIPAGTFRGCRSLEQCVIPESVELIGMQAFEYAGLKDIFIPKNAKAEIMGFGAFGGNMDLKEYKVHPDNLSYKSIDGVLYRTDGKQFILESVPGQKSGTLKVTDECTVVDSYSIGDNINSIIFNDSLDVIKEYAVNGSPALSHIKIPGNVTVYPNSFWYCSNLASVSLVSGSKQYNDIFIGCDKLSTIYIQDAGEMINLTGIFDKEPELLNIYFETLAPELLYTGKMKVWIPGGAIIDNDIIKKDLCTEMWDLSIDRAHGYLEINPKIDGLEITEVLLNGNIQASINGRFYDLPQCINPDIVVNYTLHDCQEMSTHYDPVFTATIKDTDLTVVSDIILEVASIDLYAGQTLQLTPSVTPSFADTSSIKWTSSNESVATVDANGNVTAIALGEAIITATCGEVSANCTVKVSPILVETLTIDPTVWSGEKGSELTITATVLPVNATDKTLVWKSSDEDIATVDAEGNVKVLKEGTCTITVSTTDGSDLTAECVITSLSGVEAILGEDADVDVYDMNGVLVKKGCERSELEQLLTPGVYVLRSGNTTVKAVVR